MSIGNLKDSGNQGNNLPWQWKVLQGLQAILDEVAEPLTCLEDSVTICNENIDALTFTDIPLVGESLNVNIANTIPLEVIITEANDSILIYGNDGTTNRKIKTDTAGELQVDVLTMPATFAEDTAHVSGNTGAFVLGVRNDLNTVMTNADGDYSPVAVNDKGAVAIQDGGNSITVDATALPLPTGAATEATLLDVKTSVQLIDDCVGTDNTAAPAKSFVVAGVTAGGTQQTIEVNASGHVNVSDGGGSITVDSNAAVRTPTILRTSTNSSVAAGAYSVSFASVGTVDSTVGGATLKPGETINLMQELLIIH